MNPSEFNSLKDIEKDIISHPNDDMSYLDGILNSNLSVYKSLEFILFIITTFFLIKIHIFCY